MCALQLSRLQGANVSPQKICHLFLLWGLLYPCLLQVLRLLLLPHSNFINHDCQACLFFSLPKSEDERQMIPVPTNALVWFPPAPFLSPATKRNAKHDLLWLWPFQKPCRSPARVARLCVVFRYGLRHMDSMWFSCWVKIEEERGREMLDSHYGGHYSTSAGGYQCHPFHFFSLFLVNANHIPIFPLFLHLMILLHPFRTFTLFG